MPGKNRKPENYLTYRVVAVTAALVFFVDLVVKTYLRTYFAYQSIPVLNKIFRITVVFNTGAAFGLLKGNTALLIGLGLIFIGLFIFLIKSEAEKGLLFFISCGMILGGAISNLTDRVFLGYIVDYLDFRIWPVFNFSDSCITVGVALLLFRSLWKKR
ncbi:MAG: signal peptidase II [Candidatus Omnitrophica bacterium]|nr:signal peptidase II [Candidatus Omnitrophota bacterium]MBU2044135.1 signal peptidase II [Candidatus Omnitrophota bacterium]MBU2250635.1 signal peptidase II [Candidatus Omnitrophota bacterium]